MASSSIITSGIFDSLPLLANFDLETCRYNHPFAPTRIINEDRQNRFREELTKADWTIACQDVDADIAYDQFLAIYKDLYDDAFHWLGLLEKRGNLNLDTPGWRGDSLNPIEKRINCIWGV